MIVDKMNEANYVIHEILLDSLIGARLKLFQDCILQTVCVHFKFL